MGTVTLFELDSHAGTELERAGVELRILKAPTLLINRRGLSAIRGSWFARQVKTIADEYDLLISGYEYLPFGRPGLHYINGDSAEFRGVTEQDGYQGLAALVHRPGFLRVVYLKLCALIARNQRPEPLTDDVLVAVSSFTARNVLRVWNKAAIVIHPPIPPTHTSKNWMERDKSIIMLGRIDRSKRIHEGIEIVRALRAIGHPVNLRIVGSISDTRYLNELNDLKRGCGSWLTIDGPVAASEKRALLANSRYLLHCKRAEPFGIVLVEAARSGCICVAPKGGGYEDFIHDDDLLFNSLDDAILKFDKLLREPDSMQYERQQSLKKDADRVGTDFEHQFRAVAESFCERRK